MPTAQEEVSISTKTLYTSFRLTSDTPVSADTLDALLARLGDKLLLQCLAALETEGDVHPTPDVLLRGTEVESLWRIEERVDEGGLLVGVGGEGGERTVAGCERKRRGLEEGTEDEGADVDGEGGGSAVQWEPDGQPKRRTKVSEGDKLEHRVVGGHVLVAEHGRNASAAVRKSSIEVDCGEGKESARRSSVTLQSLQTYRSSHP